MLELAVQGADAARAEHLVPGEGVEVAAQRRDVDLHVGRRLRTVDHRRDAALLRRGDHLGGRVDGAQRVRDMGYREDPGAGTEEPPLESSSQIELAVASFTGTARTTSAGPC